MGEIVDSLIEAEPAAQASQAGKQAGKQAAQQASQTADRASVEEVQTVGDALAPVLSWERNNVEFWMQVGQLVVLLLILREVRD